MTTVPGPAPIRFEDVFSRSWALFRRNWIVALPPVIAIAVAGVVVTVVIVLFTIVAVGAFAGHRGGGAGASFIGTLVIGSVLAGLLMIVAALWSQVAIYGMADAAWARGTATFADGFAAFRTRAGATLVAFIGVIALVFAALILLLPTLGLSLFALPLLTMYVFPAVIAGGRGGFEAIGESFRLVRRHFVVSLVTVLIVYAISYGISFVGAFGIVPLEFSVIPPDKNGPPVMPPIPLLVGGGGIYLVSLVLQLAYQGFMAIVLVGLYRDLIAQPDPQPRPPLVVPG